MIAPLFSAHIGYLFTELPLEERIAAARRAGFEAVEHPNPRSIPAARMRELLDAEGMIFTQMAVAIGDASRSEKGLAALIGRQAEFREDFLCALDYAEATGCRFLHPMAGVVADDQVEAARVYAENLDFAAETSRSAPIRLLVEAISDAVVPGYFVSTLEKAVSLTQGGEAAEIVLLLDTYHAAVNGTDIPAFLEKHIEKGGHIHVADHPGRHEPGTGELDFRGLLGQLHKLGYDGAIGFEYIPKESTDHSLSWLPQWRALCSSFPA